MLGYGKITLTENHWSSKYGGWAGSQLHRPRKQHSYRNFTERSIPGKAGSATNGTRTTWGESCKEAQRPIRYFATPKQTQTNTIEHWIVRTMYREGTSAQGER